MWLTGSPGLPICMRRGDASSPGLAPRAPLRLGSNTPTRGMDPRARMTGPLYRIGGFCSRHHWPVIAVWILAAIALALGANAAGERTNDNLTLPGTGSTEAQDLLKDKLPKQAYGTNPVVLEAGSGKLTSSRNSKAIDETVKALKQEPGVTRAVSPLSQQGSAALTKDKRIGYITVTLSEGPGDLTEEDAENIIDATSPA